MYAATMAVAAGASVTVATAAVADFRPAHTYAQKVKKSAGGATPPLELERTRDILAELGAHKNGTFLVGFAAETEQFEANAREKLRSKHLDAIAVNDVSHDGIGFGTGENELTVLFGADGRRALGRASKREIARRLWDALLEIRASSKA
jgi:phosphopantothenoylcysteine decarboxylase/phosphopantothenate--cysteine ligase